MDNFIATLLLNHKLLLKNTKTLDFKNFSKKRNYELIYGIDENNYHTLIFIRKAKSKFLQSELNFLDELADTIAEKLNIIIKKRVLFYNSQICSKVKNEKWKLYDFV